MLGWLKKKIAESPSTVVTGPGVIKTHNVECKFYSEGTGSRVFSGKLGQDRWSDGQERFSFWLSKLPKHDGTVALFRGETQVSTFEVEGPKLSFRWKGKSSEAIPQFEIGDELRAIVGDQVFKGIVEAD